jgi:CelD/BcsL family acetyltransferase involved in cellulose biosynthesis
MDHPRRPAIPLAAELGPRLYPSLSAEPALERMPHASDSTLVVERLAVIEPIAAEWDALATRLGAPPFLRPGWVEAWVEAFSARGLTVLAARRDDELVGVLPLHRRPGRVLAGTANSHSPLGGSLADGSTAALALADSMLRIGHSRADFVYTDPTDPVLAELRKRRPSIARVVSEQPYVDVSGDFDAYVASLGRKHRKEAGRLRRKLESEGELSFEFADGSERLDELLDEGLAIEGSGWKTDAGTAINSDPATKRFYTAIVRWAARHGWLRLAFLRLDGRALAFDLCLDSGGSFYALKGGFETEYRSFGPGTVLTYESLARAFADPGLRTYEFLGTADEYKRAWTSTTHERLRVQSFSRSPLGVAQLVAWRHGRPLAKRVLSR